MGLGDAESARQGKEAGTHRVEDAVREGGCSSVRVREKLSALNGSQVSRKRQAPSGQ